MEDSRIIDLFYERSEQAIAELSKKYGAVCNRVAGNILRNSLDVEECVNDAYLGAWNTIPPRRPEPLLAYLCRTAQVKRRSLWWTECRGKTFKPTILLQVRRFTGTGMI